jgi:hypothetical protein
LGPLALENHKCISVAGNVIFRGNFCIHCSVQLAA